MIVTSSSFYVFFFFLHFCSSESDTFISLTKLTKDITRILSMQLVPWKFYFCSHWDMFYFMCLERELAVTPHWNVCPKGWRKSEYLSRQLTCLWLKYLLEHKKFPARKQMVSFQAMTYGQIFPASKTRKFSLTWGWFKSWDNSVKLVPVQSQISTGKVDGEKCYLELQSLMTNQCNHIIN